MMNEELGADDVPRVKDEIEKVKQAAMKIGKAMYG